MRQLAEKYRHRPVLVLGCIDYLHVAEEYGFESVFSVADLCAAKPDLWPFFSSEQMHARMLDTACSHTPRAPEPRWPSEGIACVIQLTDAVDWAPELQVHLSI